MSDFDVDFPEKSPIFEEDFPEDIERKRQQQAEPLSSHLYDMMFSNPTNHATHVLNAFGQGVKQGWGADALGLSPETTEYLKKAGIFNDYQKGQANIIKAANEVLMRSAAMALRVPSAAIGGAQGAVAQLGEETGHAKLGREIAALPEAFPLFGTELGLRKPHLPLPPGLAEAKSLGIIGEGEAGWKGTAPPKTEAAAAADAEAVKQIAEQTPQLPGQPAEGVPAAAEVAAQPEAPTGPSPKIVADVTQKLVAAGRPADEAEAAAQLTAAYWQTRAERFNGAKGTAEDMYAAEGPEIKAGVARDKVLAQRKGESDLFQITAFHGSPYDFDRFDIGKIGTGEGAQVYGHGLYFAENPKVAGEYKSDSFGRNVATPGQREASFALPMHGGDPEKAIRYLKSKIGLEEYTPEQQATFRDAIKEIEGGWRPAQGKMYEVNIDAEPEHFLDWDKPLSEQHPKVQEGITKKLSQLSGKEATPEWIDTFSRSGEGLHSLMAAWNKHDPAATTEALREAGIPGIKYLDQGSRNTDAYSVSTEYRPEGDRYIVYGPGNTTAGIFDTREAAREFSDKKNAEGQTHNYVLFDDSKIKITKKDGKPVTGDERSDAIKELYQRQGDQFEQEAKGRIRLRDEGRATITLLKNADASTFIHETGHEWLDRMLKDATDEQAPPDLKADADTVLKWLGIDSADAVKTRHHEQFARGFETYIMEGRAPTPGLAAVFEKFRQWLTNIYRTVANLKSPINDDIRRVFNRLLATNPGEPIGDLLLREPAREESPPLLSFLASRGGIRADDGNIGDLRNSIGAQNKFVPGFGQLIRDPKQLSTAAIKSGRHAPLTLDAAREAAIEGGYIPEETTLPEFLEALDTELRGGHKGELPVEEGEQEHVAHSFVESVNDFAKENGGAELTEKERARALELWRHEGLNEPADILERLALESSDQEVTAGTAEARPEPIPGWDIPAESEPAPRGGGAAASVEPEQPGGVAARPGGEGAREEEPVLATDSLPKSETHFIDKAGNIRLDNLGTPEDVNAVIRQAAAENEGFLPARRGVVSDAQVLNLADALGMSPDQLNTRKIGEAFNAEQIVAARKLLVQSAMAVRDAAAKVAGGGEEALVAYAEARARHLMIQEQVSGITAEAGRALRAFRDLGGDHVKQGQQISDFLKASTGKTLYQLEQESQLLLELETPQQVSQAIRQAEQTRWQKIRGGIISWFINNLISGPITHAGYSVGNTMFQLYKAVPETAAAAAIGAIRNAPAAERVHLREVTAQLYGMLRGARDSYPAAVRALNTGVSFMKGDPEGVASAIEAAHRSQAIPGKIGYVIQTPSRAVSAIHTLHYGMNYEAEIGRRAVRDAFAKDLDPGSAAFNRSIAEFTQDPPAAEMEAAHNEALGMVLMAKPQFGSAAYHLQKAVNNNILAKIVMPFMQVGTNILHKGYVERTPLGLASQNVRDNLLGNNGAVARDTQVAKFGVAAGVAAAVVGLTAEETLTGGGPSDPDKRKLLEATGWKPYSIRVGEFYVPYRKYLGPLGPLIAGVSDMYEVGHALSEEGLGKAALSSMFGLAEVVADESWMRGLANFIDAARHWDRDGERYLRNLSMNFIPFSVGLQQATTLTDPYRREVHSMLDAARVHIPGLSQGLHPQRDIWGEPILSHTALGPSRAVEDPATKALLDIGYFPKKIDRAVVGIKLNDQQYDDLSRIAGRMAKQLVNHAISTPGFNQIPLGQRTEMLKKAIEMARHNAREYIKMQNYQIVQEARENKRVKMYGEKPTVH